MQAIFVLVLNILEAFFYESEICEKFKIYVNFRDWIHRITHCSIFECFIVHLGKMVGLILEYMQLFKSVKKRIVDDSRQSVDSKTTMF